LLLEGQQLVQIMLPGNASNTVASLSAGDRQIYPVWYQAEQTNWLLQGGSNGAMLNPGTWTIVLTAPPRQYQFTVPTNTPGTNNWLDLMTNGALVPVATSNGVTQAQWQAGTNALGTLANTLNSQTINLLTTASNALWSRITTTSNGLQSQINALTQ